MKYIIELEDEPMIANSFNQEVDELWKAKGFNSLVFDKYGLYKLTPYTELDRKAIEDEVWEFASMLMNMHPDVAGDIYWSMNGGKGIGVAAEMTYQEAKAKYETWKKEKEEIHVGDEVEDNDGTRGIVFDIIGTDLLGVCWEEERVSHFFWPKSYCRKTGRHFDEVDELLKKMRGEQE